MKINRTQRLCLAALASAAMFFAVSTNTKADLVYEVTIDTSALVGNPSGPFSLDLQLTEGSGNVTNTVKLFGFNLTGGAAVGSPDFTNGNESGSLATGVTLTNSTADNEFAQEFGGGVTKIQFLVDESSNSEVVGSGTPIPDQLNIAIFGADFNNLSTSDPSGFNNLISESISSGQTIGSVATYSSPTGVIASVSSIPDAASTGWLLAAAFGFCVALRGFSMRSARFA